MRTSGTVIKCPSSTGSCTSPRVSISAMAWRISSPTRNWRWVGPFINACLVCFGSFRLGRRPPHAAGGLQRALHRLHAIALDDVADAHVLVVLKGHAAFLAGDDFAGVLLEALELR